MRPDSALVDRLTPSPNFGNRRGQAVDSVILHYTGMSTGEIARTRLCNPTSEVSCHYLVWEDGSVEQLVAEGDRAWHAGRSSWFGETDMNAVSIGIEIVNAGHDGGCPPYPEGQISAVVELVIDVCRRRGIRPGRVLGHSDIAPDRKIDPGEWFPWGRLAAAGVTLDVAPAPVTNGRVLGPGSPEGDVRSLQKDLAGVGYGIKVTGHYDDQTKGTVAAFQRRFRPALVDGLADASTRTTLASVRALCATT